MLFYVNNLVVDLIAIVEDAYDSKCFVTQLNQFS
jgi:hypothetical protein